jgi:hypothetical protein
MPVVLYPDVSKLAFEVCVCRAYRAYSLLSVRERACMVPHTHVEPTVKVVLV